MYIYNIALYKQFLNKDLIFFKTKDNKNLLFQAEYHPFKTNIIWYYLLPNSTALKLCNQK